ncbi:hypothetical protein HYPSUDRAFT_200547 [Hypholoma sublateritium FD-334 SS-4]|uniref:Uncharacterized protein n=1 Tax=Hypholoma sublateritium (strain FD-334 SS-4) TaxID=945553 RepID=A0A0D2PY31_HYPSF|nr:hypothetical protein HYPSUDRAFT_200547 [Hypholoma sublateritium FD-334 SS-4]
MTTLHPFPTSRESVLPISRSTSQGMLFTNIQLYDFQATLARFLECLEIEGAEEREWIMMAVINLSSVHEYRRSNAVLRKVGCIGMREAGGPKAAAAMRVMAKKAAASMPGSTPINGVDEERNGYR